MNEYVVDASVLGQHIVELQVKLAFRDRRIAELDRLLESARSLACEYEARLGRIAEIANNTNISCPSACRRISRLATGRKEGT